jgi:hypothetical protein
VAVPFAAYNDILSWANSLLPITATVAVGLFIVREMLESLRRRRADKRRLSAIKVLLAREIELNYWAIKSYRAALDAIANALVQVPPGIVTITSLPLGDTYRIEREGRLELGGGIAKTTAETMSKHLLDVATLNRTLYHKLESSLDAAAELKHVRDSLITYVSHKDSEFPDLLSGFVIYGRSVLAEIEPKFSDLYRACTNNVLEEHRLR